MRAALRYVPVVLALLALPACSDDVPGPVDPAPDGFPESAVASIVVAPRVAKLWAVGERVTFVARCRDRDGLPIADVELAWASSRADIAQVDGAGIATATSDGWAVVTVTAGEAEGAADVVVIPPDASPDRYDCLACHGVEYAGRHSGTDTPGTCLACHVPGTWAGPAVDHEAVSGGFQLLGAHAEAPCAACHAADGTPLYPGATDEACHECHAAEYEATHAAAGYPTDCTHCHDASAWANAHFDHDADWFPVFSGVHRNKWPSCATCHVAPADFANFSCVGCHRHDGWRTDAEHAGVAGYAWESALCYACHPSGYAG